LIIFLLKYQVYSIPTCIIIDTNSNQQIEDELNNRTSSSLLLRNLRMLDNQRPPILPELVVQSIPLSYVDLKETPSTSLKKSLTEPIIDRALAPCSIKLLNQIETHTVVPFEFRRLRFEQPDHHTKFRDDDTRENLPDLSTAVYERRSDPEGISFCRTCHDGQWSQLTVCEAIRCDAELLRASPRLVTEWGEIKPVDGGVLYAPSTVFAIYAFGFGPHCKRCESNGQWSRYALPELCSGIKFFGHSTTTIVENIKQFTTTIPTAATKMINKKQ